MNGPLKDSSAFIGNEPPAIENPPDDYRLTIDKADNGWLIQHCARVEVVEEDEDAEDGEAQATQRLLYTILDMLDLRGSKHDAARVRVVIERQGDDLPE